MNEPIDFFALMKKQSKIEEPKEEKKETGSKPKQPTEAKNEKVEKKTVDSFEYPFSLYTEGKTVDISEYGFEDGKRYFGKDICDIMLKHRHYEFAGDMNFQMFKDDNMLVATAKQYKKG